MCMYAVYLGVQQARVVVCRQTVQSEDVAGIGHVLVARIPTLFCITGYLLVIVICNHHTSQYECTRSVLL